MPLMNWKIWMIPEILDIIFHNLVCDDKDYWVLSDALAVMKTCRVFYHPAVKYIWSELFNIIPLITTMPSDLWEITHKPQISSSPWTLPMVTTLTFKRKVTARDWERFDKFARLVKLIGSERHHFHSISADFVLLDESVLHELKSRDMPLLPQLQNVMLYNENNSQVPIFLTPSVRSIYICTTLSFNPDHTPMFQCLLDAISVIGPGLRGIQLSMSDMIKNETQTVLHALLRQLNLSEFACTSILPDDLLLPLLSMAALNKLSVFMELESVYATLQKCGRTIRLCKLHIQAMVVNMSLIPEILARLDASVLESLVVMSNTILKHNQVNRVITAIGNCCSPERLVELCMGRSYSFAGGPELVSPHSTISTLSSFTPILHFHALRKIEIYSHLLSLSDEDLKTLAISWPHLEELRLPTSYLNTPLVYGSVTLLGVFYVTKYCRKLQTLEVDFLATPEKMKNMPPRDEIKQATTETMKNLYVGVSEIKRPKLVAFVLGDLFPQLKHLQWRHCDDEQRRRWEIVHELVVGNDRLEYASSIPDSDED